MTQTTSESTKVLGAASLQIKSEAELAQLCVDLLGTGPQLTLAEWALTKDRRHRPSPAALDAVSARIRAGGDPLGETFLKLRSPARRRSLGATYTPDRIVAAMVRWASSIHVPDTIVDPGAGSGRFLLAAADAFPYAELFAIERDPMAALMLRANLVSRGLEKRAQVFVDDYCTAALPTLRGRTLFIGNPPYVRHHQLPAAEKEWFGRATNALGVPSSKLAGLHVYFFVRTAQLAKRGDHGVFITSSEWLDVNYGSALRALFADKIGGVGLHILDSKSLPFSDAMTTGAIACFQVGSRSTRFVMRNVKSLDKLNGLTSGKPVKRSEAKSTDRWSTLLRSPPRPPDGFVELGELFRVHRGQVTGGNNIWIASSKSLGLPDAVLFPAVTRGRELLTLCDIGRLRRVIDLPEDLDVISVEYRPALARFLRFARKHGAHQTYTARHRKAWWSVGLKEPAPILVGYMARRSPAFARNLCGARHINIAHGLYPRQHMNAFSLDAMSSWLNRNVRVDSGRTYAGGLTKFEPGEIERIFVPSLDMLSP